MIEHNTNVYLERLLILKISDQIDYAEKGEKRHA